MRVHQALNLDTTQSLIKDAYRVQSCNNFGENLSGYSTTMSLLIQVIKVLT